MKKIFLLAIALLIPSYPLQADLQTTTAKVLKCSWHAAKIGGGMLCVLSCLNSFGIGMAIQRIPPVPELPNNRYITIDTLNDWFRDATQELNALGISKLQFANMAFAQIEKNTGVRHETLGNLKRDELQTAVNQTVSMIRNRAIIAFIVYLAAGSASVKSGVKGLYDEVKQAMEPAEKEETEEISAI